MKLDAPLPNAAPFTLIQSPFSMNETARPPSPRRLGLDARRVQAIVSASWPVYGSSVPTCGAPVVVMLMVGMEPSEP